MPTAPKGRGRPKKARTEAPTPPLVIRGLSADDIAALEAITEARRVRLASEGGTTSRNAVALNLLRDAIARATAAAPAADPTPKGST